MNILKSKKFKKIALLLLAADLTAGLFFVPFLVKDRTVYLPSKCLTTDCKLPIRCYVVDCTIVIAVKK